MDTGPVLHEDWLLAAISIHVTNLKYGYGSQSLVLGLVIY